METQKLFFNPFSSISTTDYAQFKKFPFLETQTISRLTNKIHSQIRDNFIFPERLLILGEIGAGKTTSLFYIHDLLKDSQKCNVLLLSKVFSDAEDFELITGENLSKISKSPVYILIDFPDTTSGVVFKKFLDYLWNIITHKNAKNINLIFALNISHYSHSFNFSEILGKFDKFRLERLTLEETKKVIKSRLQMAGSDDYFEEGVYNVIFRFSKGIPRNIICASKNLVEEFFNKEKVTELEASNLLKIGYIEQIIHDRIEDPINRNLYKKVIDTITNDFHGFVEIQRDLVDNVTAQTNVGKNKIMKIISNLEKFGIINLSRGGKNNVNKVISLK